MTIKVPIELPENIPSLLNFLEYNDIESKWLLEWRKYLEDCDWIARRYLDMQCDSLKELIRIIEKDKEVEEE